jgi:hypothetical protein
MKTESIANSVANGMITLIDDKFPNKSAAMKAEVQKVVTIAEVWNAWRVNITFCFQAANKQYRPVRMKATPNVQIGTKSSIALYAETSKTEEMHTITSPKARWRADSIARTNRDSLVISTRLLMLLHLVQSAFRQGMLHGESD